MNIAMKKYLFTALFALLVHLVVAQDATTRPKAGIAVQPQNLFMHGLRVDIQPYVGERNQLVFAPQFHFSNGGSWIFNTGSSDVAVSNVDFQKLRGFGLEFNYRIFSDAGVPLYGAFGVGYNFFRPTYISNNVQIPFAGQHAPGGSFTLERAENYQKINRWKLNLLMGYTVPTMHGFFFDLYWGLGFRYGTASKNLPDNVNFTRGMWNMAYQGFSLELGLKVGLDL